MKRSASSSDGRSLDRLGHFLFFFLRRWLVAERIITNNENEMKKQFFFLLLLQWKISSKWIEWAAAVSSIDCRNVDFSLFCFIHCFFFSPSATATAAKPTKNMMNFRLQLGNSIRFDSIRFLCALCRYNKQFGWIFFDCFFFFSSILFLFWLISSSYSIQTINLKHQFYRLVLMTDAMCELVLARLLVHH